MARQLLKSDLFRLQQVFTKNHQKFRILSASVDEMTCRFILKNQTFFDIQANITDSYPSAPPLWFVISEDATIIDLLEKPLETVNNSEGCNNRIIDQVVSIVHLLCRIYDEPLPEELDLLVNSNAIVERDEDTGNDSDEASEENADDDEIEDEEFESEAECDDDDDDDEEMFNMDASASSSSSSIATSNPTESEMDAENARILKKQKNLQFEKQSESAGNNSCNKVLLKELDTIYRSETYKNKTYSVELIDDALNVWNVQLMSVCPDSLLHSDLNRLKQQGLSGSIQMRITFEETFPFSPPFIQVTYPAIKGGHVLDQGALCMELLTTQGWSSAYSMENVLIQISSTLITGHARVDFEKTKVILGRPYDQEQARKMFEYHANLHKKNGWTLPAAGNS